MREKPKGFRKPTPAVYAIWVYCTIMMLRYLWEMYILILQNMAALLS